MSAEAPSILLVDDDIDTCRNVSDILVDLGFQVDVAHDGPSALDLARDRAYDVALLDLKMPGMDGLTLYRRLKTTHPGTVALLVTAYASDDTAAEALSAGAWRVMRKPVDMPSLLTLIDQAVEQPMVLVVDDDRDLCDNLWDVLRERDVRVCLAHDVPEAVETLRSCGRRFQVVLIDMRLPGGDGRAVFRQVRSADPLVRTVLITGARPETDPMIEETMAEGADAVCYKPFDLPALLSLLERLIGTPSSPSR